jgi:hypothetical protein
MMPEPPPHGLTNEHFVLISYLVTKGRQSAKDVQAANLGGLNGLGAKEIHSLFKDLDRKGLVYWFDDTVLLR